MSKHKKKLISFLIIQAVLTILNKLLGKTVDEDWYSLSNTLYWAAMFWGIFIIYYAFRVRCSQCYARQVFRGFSAFDIRWPEKKCYKCGEKIE